MRSTDRIELREDEANTRIEDAIKLLLNYAQTDGGHHKTWCLDQVLKALTGPRYEEFIHAYEYGFDDEDLSDSSIGYEPDDKVWEWDTGVAP